MIGEVKANSIAPSLPLISPRFAIGQHVTVRAEWPEALCYQHIRTPSYVRGHRGVVERCFGVYPNPEDLAFGRPAQRCFLYHVAFHRASIWPEQSAGNHANVARRDIVLIELYEHWLEDSEAL